MPLTTAKQLLTDAQKHGYAVPAFNIENMEMAQAVIEAAARLRSPLILQTTPSTVKYAGLKVYAAIVAALAQEADIPIALHLDHGDSYDLAVKAMEAGYTSIMIDGSPLSLADNIAVTAKVVQAAASHQIPVEGELGRVGGKEDSLEAGAGDTGTDPQEAREFVAGTGVDSLAIAIGTAHGIYKGTPKIDVERLKEVRKVVDIPLVLHGTTGVDGAIVQQCVRAGMCKVNYATELRIAFSDGIKAVLEKDPAAYDPKIFGRAGMSLVKAAVEKNIGLCFSANRC